jgi:putative membrane protein
MTLTPYLKKNDTTAYVVIAVLSVVVFVAVAFLRYGDIKINLGFNPHIFALINAFINGTVSVLLVLGLYLVKQKNYEAHRNVMLLAIALSSLFLVSYIMHHIMAAETPYPKDAPFRTGYLVILISHIILATFILPVILLTAYRSLTGEYARHKKIAKYTFPLWLYVSVTGVLVYLLISPYYK